MGVLRIILIGLFVFTVQSLSVGQSLEKSALKSIQKKNWPKADASLRKSLRKDTLNSLARYLVAYSFFQKDNPSFHLDSAYYYSLGALADYARTPARERAKLKRFPFDSARIVTLRERIDSAAFQYALTENTEAGYIEFLRKHPLDLRHRPQAIELRNEVAYQTALREHTYQALLNFINKYPDAVRIAEAREHYDRLLYESLTKDKRLSTFESFLNEHPDSPFRMEVEQNIFDLTTLSGEASGFIQYLKRYPRSSHAKKARNILFHLLLEQNTTDWPDDFLSDSLLRVIRLQQSYIIPFLRAGKFGFINSEGLEVMSPILTGLPDEYKCEYFTDDFIILDDKVIARDGHPIFTGPIESVEDIGNGFLKLRSNGCFTVVHKSGFIANPCTADARTLGSFIAFKNDSVWTLHALAGRKLLNRTFDEVSMIGKVFALEKGDYVYVTSKAKILRAAESQAPLFMDSVAEAKEFGPALIWIKTDKGEGVLDQNLKELLPVSDQTLQVTSFGVVGKTATGYNLYSLSDKHASSFADVIDKRPWLVVQKDGLWYLINSLTFGIESEPFDSVGFQGPMFVGRKPDTLVVHFSPGVRLKFPEPVRVNFLPGLDSTAFLILEQDNKRTLYSSAGKVLFTIQYDQIQHAGRNLFVVTREGKKGLVNSDGKIVLPLEYDGIGSINENTISLLRNFKFGLYHVTTRKLIKPQFEKNIIALSPTIFLAFKDGGYGFIATDGKATGKFEFDEIQNWNDSTLWLKQNAGWNLVNIRTRRIALSDVEEVNIFLDTPGEKIARIRIGDSFGVLSNTRGTVIPVSFSDLVQLGPPDEPTYFTEKHVAEASIFVVIYYDAHGKLIRREVYEDSDEYEKIYCSDN
jgi:hypothetical protein